MKTQGWQHRLTAYLSSVAALPFEAGKLDCALFTAGAVAAMTGVDHARGWRGKYRSLAKGRKVLEKAGFADHVALAASLYPEVAPIMAQEGDIAVVPAEDGEIGFALGIVQGPMIYVMGHTGLTLVPLTSATRAFRV
jgi:hypothetical protein